MPRSVEKCDFVHKVAFRVFRVLLERHRKGTYVLGYSTKLCIYNVRLPKSVQKSSSETKKSFLYVFEILVAWLYDYDIYFPWSIWPTIVTTGGLGTRSSSLGGLWTTSKFTSSSRESLGLWPTILNLHPNLVAIKLKMCRFPRGSLSELIVHFCWKKKFLFH